MQFIGEEEAPSKNVTSPKATMSQKRWVTMQTKWDKWEVGNRVIQSCHLLANYCGTYFPTYSIMKSRRSAISGIMNFVDNYSYCPTYRVTFCSAYPPLPFCIQTLNDFFFLHCLIPLLFVPPLTVSSFPFTPFPLFVLSLIPHIYHG